MRRLQNSLKRISSQVHSTGLCHLSALYNPFIIYSINNLSATIPQRISCAGDRSICSNVNGCIEGIHHVRRYLVRTRHEMRISHRHLNGRVSYVACYCGQRDTTHDPPAASGLAVVVPLVNRDAGLQARIEPVGHLGHSTTFGVYAQEGAGLLALRQPLVSSRTDPSKWYLAHHRLVRLLLLVDGQPPRLGAVVIDLGSERLGHSHPGVCRQQEDRKVVRAVLLQNLHQLGLFLRSQVANRGRWPPACDEPWTGDCGQPSRCPNRHGTPG